MEMINLKVGDFYKMGSYQGEEINWIVLAIEQDRALLLSEKALDTKPYNQKYKVTGWDGCDIQRWLNGRFYNTAFTSDEQTRIETTSTSYYTSYDNLRVSVFTKVFLLNKKEAEQYLDPVSRCIKPTEFAKKSGAYIESNTKCCWWWLRDRGYNDYTAAYVNYDGWINETGEDVDHNRTCVRPALWINLE